MDQRIRAGTARQESAGCVSGSGSEMGRLVGVPPAPVARRRVHQACCKL